MSHFHVFFEDREWVVCQVQPGTQYPPLLPGSSLYVRGWKAGAVALTQPCPQASGCHLPHKVHLRKWGKWEGSRILSSLGSGVGDQGELCSGFCILPLVSHLGCRAAMTLAVILCSFLTMDGSSSVLTLDHNCRGDMVRLEGTPYFSGLASCFENT